MPTTQEAHTRQGVRCNAKTWANNFEARLLEAGLVSYRDIGCGTLYLSHETISRCAPSFVGRPVIVGHRRMSPETMEQHAQGYITNVWFNEEDGWWWCRGSLHGEEAKEKVRKGAGVSCSYRSEEDDTPGEYHALAYNGEITNFEGNHLAIVDNPRYERAIIRLNSKTQKMFKFIKKLLGGETKDNAAKTPEAEEVSGESTVEIEGHGAVTVKALVERYNSVPSDEVDVDGKKVKINDLVAGYKANEAAKAQAEEKAKKDEEEKKERDNAKKAEDEAGKKAFDDLLHARDNAQPDNVAPSVDTLEARLERARVRYSLKKN